MSRDEILRREGLEEIWGVVILEVERHGTVVDPATLSAEHDAVVHVITAWNPASTAVDAASNIRADAELAAELVQRSVHAERCTGRHPDGSWREEGWAIVGLTREQACELGRHFGQDALYEVTDACTLVVWCDTGRAVSLSDPPT